MGRHESSCVCPNNSYLHGRQYLLQSRPYQEDFGYIYLILPINNYRAWAPWLTGQESCEYNKGKDTVEWSIHKRLLFSHSSLHRVCLYFASASSLKFRKAQSWYNSCKPPFATPSNWKEFRTNGHQDKKLDLNISPLDNDPRSETHCSVFPVCGANSNTSFIKFKNGFATGGSWIRLAHMVPGLFKLSLGKQICWFPESSRCWRCYNFHYP